MRVPFCYCCRSCPCYYCSLAALLFPITPISPTQYRKDRPPCQIIHSLLYCITSIMDSLWTERSYHSSGMSAGFSVPASFAFIYLAAFFFNRKDCMFGECRYHDASRNVSQQRFSSRRQEAWALRRSLPCLYFQPQVRSQTPEQQSCKVTCM